MNNKIGGTFSIIAAIIVLFTAMLDPKISIIISIAALIFGGIYNFAKK